LPMNRVVLGGCGVAGAAESLGGEAPKLPWDHRSIRGVAWGMGPLSPLRCSIAMLFGPWCQRRRCVGPPG
jgi:hypothetical protein